MRSGWEGTGVERGGAYWGKLSLVFWGLQRACFKTHYFLAACPPFISFISGSWPNPKCRHAAGSRCLLTLRSGFLYSGGIRIGEEQGRHARRGLREARQPTGYTTPFNIPVSPSILHLGLCSYWQGLKTCPWLRVRGAIYVIRFLRNSTTKLLQVWQKMRLPYNEFLPVAPGFSSRFWCLLRGRRALALL